MGLLSDLMNEDFDRRIAIADELGIPVHSDEMMKAQIAERMGDSDAFDKLKKKNKRRIRNELAKRTKFI